jgi:hypothetical protein
VRVRDSPAGGAPLDEKEPEKEPPEQDPLGFDFWAKNVFRVPGVVIGITLSGLFGFGSASRFAQREEVRRSEQARLRGAPSGRPLSPPARVQEVRRSAGL